MEVISSKNVNVIFVLFPTITNLRTFYDVQTASAYLCVLQQIATPVIVSV
jgi:hypothetical protein